MTDSSAPKSRARPTSPHLQIYRLPMAALISISHRFTGIALSVGLFVLVAWLWCGAFSAPCFQHMHEFFSTILGRLMLFGWTFAFFYHLCSGTRHLIWDTGTGFEKPVYKMTNWIVVGAALVLTLGVWAVALGGAR